jgi:DNA-directed RNA polymerase subunit M/transcription elongation factor TFIIS
MNNACPECGAVYAVAEKDIGRRIACKKCSSALVVTEEGLVRDEVAASPKKDDTPERDRSRARDDDDRPRRRDDEDDDRPRRRRDRDDDEGTSERPRKPRGPGMGEYLKKLKGIAGMGDVSTWLYGIGLFLTIYSFFSPRIDLAKTKSREGAKEVAKRDFDVYERSINKKPDGKTPTADETKTFEERKKEYERRTEPELDDDIFYARASEKRGDWWTQIYRMIGFFLLAFGSIGYLAPEQSMLKRILGGGTILLILLQVIGGGVTMLVGVGGGKG